MQEEYKGYVIEWNDWSKYFVVKKEGVEVKEKLQSVKDANEWIDQKNKQKFKRVPVIHRFGYGDEREFGEATSIVDIDHVWVSSKKNRNKVRVSEVWLDCEENRNILKHIQDKNKTIDTLRNEIEELKMKTKRLTMEMLKQEE